MEQKLKNILVQGWVGMLFLLFLMILTDLVEFGMRSDFTSLNSDPGIAGLWFIVIFSSVNVLMQISIQTFDSKGSRWVFLFITVIYTFIMIAHQLNHLVTGEGFDMHFVLDVTHHILGIGASIAAYKYVKLGNYDKNYELERA